MVRHRYGLLRTSTGQFSHKLRMKKKRLGKSRKGKERAKVDKQIANNKNKRKGKNKEEKAVEACRKYHKNGHSTLSQLLAHFDNILKCLEDSEIHGRFEKFQNDLDRIYEWASKNNMEFNSKRRKFYRNDLQKKINGNYEDLLQMFQMFRHLVYPHMNFKMTSLVCPQMFQMFRHLCQIPKPPPTVKLHEHGTFTTTEYIPRNILIKKENLSQSLNAKRRAAQEEDARKRKAASDAQKLEEANNRKELRGKYFHTIILYVAASGSDA
ncbi:unnamed protein product, partial [Meganyctiphanes norvegica]